MTRRQGTGRRAGSTARPPAAAARSPECLARIAGARGDASTSGRPERPRQPTRRSAPTRPGDWSGEHQNRDSSLPPWGLAAVLDRWAVLNGPADLLEIVFR